MDEEKMQRQMEFLVEWQAQFAAELGELKENVKQNTENIARLVGVVERVVDTVERLAQVTAERFEETDRKIAALVDAQIRTEEEARKREDAMRKLTETVDRHTADGHGGKRQPES